MNPASATRSLLSRILLLILIMPLALGFIIAACLAAGPTEVFKALTGRK
jgi:hypothetical protein